MSIHLEPILIPKYINQLKIPPVYYPEIIRDTNTGDIISYNYVVTISQFKQSILPRGFPKTTVWGYGGRVINNLSCKSFYNYRSSPGPTFEAVRGIPINVQWINDLSKSNRIVPHIHGGENHSIFDGHPKAWFTKGEYITGSQFVTSNYNYPNEQEAATLWYHDYTFDIARLNVLMGLSGFYIVRDPANKLESRRNCLPARRYDIPIVIQDRSFNTDGSFDFPNAKMNQKVHSYWNPKFFGDTIMVNGKVWPNLNVKKHEYRFRLLNGSNARFYKLQFSSGMSFIQIASDGGYLREPVRLTSLLLAPGERAEIIVNFSSLRPGSKIILENHANAPFPNGTPPDYETVGQVMQFTVMNSVCRKPNNLPERLNQIPKLVTDSPKRILLLFKVIGDNGSVQVLLNGQTGESPVFERLVVGSTEEWEIINLTEDTHPIHLHLVQFQVLNRQNFNKKAYINDWIKENGDPPLDHSAKTIPVEKYLEGEPRKPQKNELGWKDTVRVNPGEVTRIVIRFAPQDVDPRYVKPGESLYPFNPTTGPGYIWH